MAVLRQLCPQIWGLFLLSGRDHVKQDAFSGFHPVVNLIFFLGVLGFGVVILHPAFLLVGITAAVSYYLLLHGLPGIRRILLLLPLFFAATLLNPLINHHGATVLFSLFGMPYTLEALVYGAVLAGMFSAMILWFGCWNTVLIGDKLTCLFGNLLPSLSLLLVMTFRLIPSLIRKGRQITGARASVGKDLSNSIAGSAAILSALVTWALEGSLITADSMVSRGYGSGKRVSFQIYHMTRRDWVLLALLLLLILAMIGILAVGGAAASFTPEWSIQPVFAPFLLIYSLFTLIPCLLHVREALIWHISRSRI